MKKRQQQQKMKALLCLSAIKLVSPFLDCGQDNSLPRQGQHRQDQLRGVLRGRFFLDVPISNIFAGGWKHGYSHEDGCGGVSWQSWHLRVRG